MVESSMQHRMAIYGKDVYMWNSYFKQAYLQDIVRFKVHEGQNGMPQVCDLFFVMASIFVF